MAADKGIKVKRDRDQEHSKEVKDIKEHSEKVFKHQKPPHLKAREYEGMLDGYKDKIKEMLKVKYIGTRIFA